MDNASRIPDNRPRRRVIPIVDSRFQWKYTLLIMALGVGLTAIMGGFLYKAHKDNTRLLDLAGNQQLQAEVMQGDQIFLLYLIILVVLMGVGLGFWGLIVTHRISGPLYIVARYLSVIGAGRYPDMRPLRKRDELHDFFSAFEEAVNTMRERDKATLAELEEAIGAVDNADGGDAETTLKVIRAMLEKYRDSVANTLGQEGVEVEGD